MGKVNISFNNTNYNIDESSISEVSDKLKQHLSTVMNGSGAVINLGGTSYNIDSAKLSTATNSFISHLGTIAGNGSKVIVNGVEYAIDSVKMGDAIAELHNVLNNLKSESDGDGDLVKNQYGFYYNEPYVYTFDMDGNNLNCAEVFFENGIMISFSDEFTSTSILFPDSGAGGEYTYNETTNTINIYDVVKYKISNDGCLLTADYYDIDTLEITGTIEMTIDKTMYVHGVYYGYGYINQNGDRVEFTEDGTITIARRDDTPEVITNNQWFGEHWGYVAGTHYFGFSIDGEYLNMYDAKQNQDFIYRRSTK